MDDTFAGWVQKLISFVRFRVHERTLRHRKIEMSREQEKLWQRVEIHIYEIEELLDKLVVLESRKS